MVSQVNDEMISVFTFVAMPGHSLTTRWFILLILSLKKKDAQICRLSIHPYMTGVALNTAVIAASCR
jgi:hypothetical protein